MRQIIDTHTHLYDLPDPLAVLCDAAAAGVSDVIALGVDLASNQKHLEIKAQGTRHKAQDAGHKAQDAGHVAQDTGHMTGLSVPGAQCPNMHIALGLHPGNITSPQDTEACFEFMRAQIKEAKAIGETGLDFWYKWVRKDDDKKREQRDVFGRHLALAREFDLPVVIHSRGAWRECLEMTLAAGVRKAEFHWYSGPLDVLKDILDAGLLISCTPALAYSPELRKAVELAPLERIMIETDTPVAYRQGAGGRELEKKPLEPGITVSTSPSSMLQAPCSTPKDVWRTLTLLSAIKQRSEDDVLAVVNRNAREFFGL